MKEAYLKGFLKPSTACAETATRTQLRNRVTGDQTNSQHIDIGDKTDSITNEVGSVFKNNIIESMNTRRTNSNNININNPYKKVNVTHTSTGDGTRFDLSIDCHYECIPLTDPTQGELFLRFIEKHLREKSVIKISTPSKSNDDTNSGSPSSSMISGKVLVAWRSFICSEDQFIGQKGGHSVFGGDLFDIATPADPTYWLMIPTLERLLQKRFLLQNKIGDYGFSKSLKNMKSYTQKELSTTNIKLLPISTSFQLYQMLSKTAYSFSESVFSLFFTTNHVKKRYYSQSWSFNPSFSLSSHKNKYTPPPSVMPTSSSIPKTYIRIHAPSSSPLSLSSSSPTFLPSSSMKFKAAPTFKPSTGKTVNNNDGFSTLEMNVVLQSDPRLPAKPSTTKTSLSILSRQLMSTSNIILQYSRVANRSYQLNNNINANNANTKNVNNEENLNHKNRKENTIKVENYTTSYTHDSRDLLFAAGTKSNKQDDKNYYEMPFIFDNLKWLDCHNML